MKLLDESAQRTDVRTHRLDPRRARESQHTMMSLQFHAINGFPSCMLVHLPECIGVEEEEEHYISSLHKTNQLTKVDALLRSAAADFMIGHSVTAAGDAERDGGNGQDVWKAI